MKRGGSNIPHPARASHGHPSPAGGEGAGRILVAQFGAPHGVRGAVRLKAFTEDPLALEDYSPLESEDGTRQFTITSLRPAKDMLVAEIEGVNDRDAAEALKHLRLYVPRERLPHIDEDETWYAADLIGLPAFDASGGQVGTVTAIQNYGAGDVIEIAPGAGGPSILLPFTKAAVPLVDIANRKVVIDPPVETSGENFPPLKGED